MKINGVDITSIASINGVPLGSIAKVNGVPLTTPPRPTQGDIDHNVNGLNTGSLRIISIANADLSDYVFFAGNIPGAVRGDETVEWDFIGAGSVYIGMAEDGTSTPSDVVASHLVTGTPWATFEVVIDEPIPGGVTEVPFSGLSHFVAGHP
jgi:hypothetical protein